MKIMVPDYLKTRIGVIDVMLGNQDNLLELSNTNHNLNKICI